MQFSRQEYWSGLPFPSLVDHVLTMPKLYCVGHNKFWKILQEMGIPDHLTCFLRNLYAGQEAPARTGCGTTDWFQVEKGVPLGVSCHPAYITYMQSTSCEMPG